MGIPARHEFGIRPRVANPRLHQQTARVYSDPATDRQSPFLSFFRFEGPIALLTALLKSARWYGLDN